MARTNLNATRVKPRTPDLITLRVLRRERISPHFARVTLGHGDIELFEPMGYDQWFRLFIPVQGGTLERVPRKLTTGAYLKYLTISKTKRPVLRNYTVRAYRPDGPEGPELDVDFVLHGSAADGTAGPAASWAETCAKGDPVALLDEGIGFNPPPDTSQVFLVADESGLPAVAGILDSLPADATGRAIVEIPSGGDAQDLRKPAGVSLDWVARETGAGEGGAGDGGAGDGSAPGDAALAAAIEAGVPDDPFFGWTVGEQSLPTRLRGHWVTAGVPKEHIMFCGYWRAAKDPAH